MRNFFLPLVFISVLISNSNAQHDHKHHIGCGADEVYKEQLLQNPLLQQRRESIEAHTAEFIRNYTEAERNQTIYTIPVVFHVINNTKSISEMNTLLTQLIADLNTNYSSVQGSEYRVELNQPAFDTWYTGYNTIRASDTGIRFCLAKRTPSDGSTTGIEYYTRSRQTWGNPLLGTTNVYCFDPTTQGIDPWNTAKYLNIWICKFDDNSYTTGFATYPGSSPDGVVLDFKVFDDMYYNKGETPTHEVGHYLNLKHLWGENFGVCGDDDVSDTPMQDRPTATSPTTANIASGAHISSCNQHPGDMYMNYMDWTPYACMFTNGQKIRMRALLAPGGLRAAMATSNGCTPPPASSICPTMSLSAPTNLTSTRSSNTAMVYWNSVSGATKYRVYYKKTTDISFTTNDFMVTTGTRLRIFNLMPSTNYQWYVVAIAVSGSSTCTSPAPIVRTFTTASLNQSNILENAQEKPELNEDQSKELVFNDATEPASDLFTVYPNPTENIANVEFLSEHDVTINLIITDLMGKIIIQQCNTVSKNISQTIQLDLSSLPAGLYVIRANDGTNSTTQKLAVQH